MVYGGGKAGGGNEDGEDVSEETNLNYGTMYGERMLRD